MTPHSKCFLYFSAKGCLVWCCFVKLLLCIRYFVSVQMLGVDLSDPFVSMMSCYWHLSISPLSLAPDIWRHRSTSLSDSGNQVSAFCRNWIKIRHILIPLKQSRYTFLAPCHSKTWILSLRLGSFISAPQTFRGDVLEDRTKKLIIDLHEEHINSYLFPPMGSLRQPYINHSRSLLECALT